MNILSKAKNSFILILKGVAVGIGNAIPGVSGGTIAVVTKIFDRLMETITPNIKKLIQNMSFLFPVGVGMLIGIFLTSAALDRLFAAYYVPTQLFFMGLILGSLPIVLRECKKESKRIRPINLIPFFIGAFFMIVLLFAGEGESIFAESEKMTFGNAVLYVVMGSVSAAAMVIPGVSGSMIMKVLGAYDSIIGAVASLDILFKLNNMPFEERRAALQALKYNVILLALFAAGAVLGIFAAVRLIGTVLKKYRQGTYCLIIGLIVGSVPHIYPDGFRFNAQGIVGILLMLAGIAIPCLTELPSRKKSGNPTSEIWK